MMKPYTFAIVSLLSCTGFASAQNLTTALDGLTKTGFGRDSQLVIGDTLDALDVAKPKERCVEYKEIKADTPGAVSSDLTFRFIRDMGSFENTLKLNYSVQAASSANAADLIKGDSTLKIFGNLESYVKRANEDVLIIIEARSDHGRDMINDFSLKAEYQALIDAKRFGEFRVRCGTHFVRGWNKASGLRLLIQIAGLDTQSKLLIENSLSSTAGGTIGLSNLSATVKSDIAAKVASTLSLAEKLGRVTAKVEAIGGTGIGTVAGILRGGDLASADRVNKLLDGLQESAKDFSAANAAPQDFIIVTNPWITEVEAQFRSSDYDRLGKIYKALVRVDQRLEILNSYQSRDPELWEAYFRIQSAEATRLRDELVKAYAICRDESKCDYVPPTDIAGMLLQDVLVDGSLSAKCRHAYTFVDTVEGEAIDKFNYISSVALAWTGTVNFREKLDLESVQLKAIRPDLTVEKLSYDAVRQLRLKVNSTRNTTRMFLDVAHEEISRPPNGSVVSLDDLRKSRNRIAQSIYIVQLNTNSGYELEEILGKPSMSECPVQQALN